MTRPVDSGKAANYLKKADGSMRMAKIAIKEGEFDSAVMNAVHSAINSLDALTTFYLGKRASGAPDLMTKDEAEKAVKWADRIARRVKEKVKRS